jgi:hypothetical protein
MVPHEQSYASSVNSGLLFVLRSEARPAANGHTEGVQSPGNPCRIQLLSSHIQSLAQYYGTYTARYGHVHHRPTVFLLVRRICNQSLQICVCM